MTAALAAASPAPSTAAAAEREPLIEPAGIAALVRLVQLTQPLVKGTLPKLLLMAVSHPVSRREVIAQLLELLFLAQTQSAGAQSQAAVLRTTGREVAATSMPPLVVRRVLDILFYLSSNSTRVTADLLGTLPAGCSVRVEIYSFCVLRWYRYNCGATPASTWRCPPLPRLPMQQPQPLLQHRLRLLLLPRQ